METTVYIKDMRLYAYHGVLEQERVLGNEYIVNVNVNYPWMDAAVTDNVNDTMNYATLADIIATEMAVPSNLLEHVAKRIADKIITTYPKTISILIDIRKAVPPMPHITDGCGVTLCIKNIK